MKRCGCSSRRRSGLSTFRMNFSVMPREDGAPSILSMSLGAACPNRNAGVLDHPPSRMMTSQWKAVSILDLLHSTSVGLAARDHAKADLLDQLGPQCLGGLQR